MTALFADHSTTIATQTAGAFLGIAVAYIEDWIPTGLDSLGKIGLVAGAIVVTRLVFESTKITTDQHRASIESQAIADAGERATWESALSVAKGTIDSLQADITELRTRLTTTEAAEQLWKIERVDLQIQVASLQAEIQQLVTNTNPPHTESPHQ